MDRIIEVKVSGNYISKDNKNAGVRGEANVTNLRITFDEGWDGYAKKITFWDALGNNPVKRELGKSPVERILTADLLEDISQSTMVYIVPIPEEAMTEAGMLTFVIDGYKDGKKQRSIEDKLEVKDAPIASEAGEPITPTADQATQLQLQIDTLLGDIQLERKDAQAASQKASEYAEKSQVAERFAESAEQFAEDAEKSSLKAQQTVGKTSYIGENGNWFAWDSEEGTFYDTGVKAQSGSTVYCGDNPPDEADVWIDPNGEPFNYYTKEETEAKLEGVLEEVNNLSDGVDEHKEDVNNPHKVTASQVGAYTKEEVDIEFNHKANKSDVAYALRESVSGEIISLTDISPIEPNMAVSVATENLISYPYAEGTHTENGVTFIDNGDGSIRINGTATGNYAFFYFTPNIIGNLNDMFEDGETYRISCTQAPNIWVVLQCNDLNDSTVHKYYSNNETFTVNKSKYNYSHLRIQIQAGRKVSNVLFKPKIIKDTALNVFGKNLLNNTCKSGSKNGMTYTVNEDRSITLNGTATGDCYIKIGETSLRKGTYFMSGCPSGGNASTYNMYCSVDGVYVYDVGNGKAFTVDTGEFATRTVYIYIKKGLTMDNKTFKPMVEYGESATPYEPYVEPTTYTPNADGTVEGIKIIYPNMTLLTDRQGVNIECEYNKDLNKVIENLTNAIISLGGNV